MLIDWTFSHNPIRYPMNDSIVWVWFKKKRCPVELNCSIVFLIEHNKINKKCIITKLKLETSQSESTKKFFYLYREYREWIKGFHWFAILGNEFMEKAHERDILTAVKRITNKHHPFPTKCFEHQTSIESTIKFKLNHYICLVWNKNTVYHWIYKSFYYFIKKIINEKVNSFNTLKL